MPLLEIEKNSSGVPTGDYKLVAGSTNFADNPIGTILPYGGSTVPSGWFLCQGQAVSRTTYAELFAVIGTSFGSGDGSTTFNLPDMRESVPKGAGLTGKTVGAHLDADGLAVGEFLDDRVQTGNVNVRTTSGSFEYALALGGSSSSSTAKNMAGNFGYSVRTGNTTEVKSVGVNYIIKAKMVGVPADFMAKVDEAVEDAISPYYHKCIYARTNKSGSELVKTLVLEDGKCYTIEGYQGDNYKRTRVYLFSGTIRTVNEISTSASPFTLSSSSNVLTITFANWSYNQCRIYEESPANDVTIG